MERRPAEDLLAFSPPSKSSPFSDVARANAYAPFMEPSRPVSSPPKQKSSLQRQPKKEETEALAVAATTSAPVFNFQVCVL